MFRSGKFWSLGFFSRFVKGKEDCEGFAENLGFRRLPGRVQSFIYRTLELGV